MCGYICKDMKINCIVKLTLVVFVHHNHAAVPETASGWRVAAGNVAAFYVLWHRCSHVDGLYALW